MDPAMNTPNHGALRVALLLTLVALVPLVGASLFALNRMTQHDLDDLQRMTRATATSLTRQGETLHGHLAFADDHDLPPATRLLRVGPDGVIADQRGSVPGGPDSRYDDLLVATAVRGGEDGWGIVLVPEPLIIARHAISDPDTERRLIAARRVDALWTTILPWSEAITLAWLPADSTAPAITDTRVSVIPLTGPDGTSSGWLQLQSSMLHRRETLSILRHVTPFAFLMIIAAGGSGWVLHRRSARRWQYLMREEGIDRALHTVHAGTWWLDGSTRLARWNAAMGRLHGLAGEQEAVSEARWLSLLHPEDQSRIAADIPEMERTGHADMRYRVPGPDGGYRWLHNVAAAERNDRGERTGCWHGIAFDVTDSITASERVRVSEERYRAIVEVQTDAVCRWLPDTTITYANDYYLRLVGMTAGDIGRRRWVDFIPEAARDGVMQVYRDLAATPRTLTYEHAVVATDGQPRWIMWIDVPLLDAEGRCREIQSVGRDITERKKTEEALRNSEERYRQIVDTAMEGVWSVDHEANTTFVNRRMADLLGYREAEMVGRPLFDFMDEAARAEAGALFAQRREGMRGRHEFRFRRKDGQVLWAIVSANPLFDATGAFRGSLGLITDITSRKAIEQDLQLREALFRTVFESSPLGIALVNPDGTTRQANEALAAMLGYPKSDMDRTGFAEVTHPEDVGSDLTLFRQLIRGEIKQYELEKRLIHKEGFPVWVRIHCSRINGPEALVVGVVENISARRKLESAMRTLFERTAHSVGDAFIQQMVRQLAEVLEVDMAFAAEHRPDGTLRCLATHRRSGANIDDTCPGCTGLVCARLLQGHSCLHADEQQLAACPNFTTLNAMQARAFIGTPLFDGQGQVMGALGIINGGTLRDPEVARELMQIFAVRTAAELERRRHDAVLAAMTSDLENRVQERTAQLAMQALAMDTTIEGMAVLKDGRYIYMNEPHAAMYGYLPGDLIGESWERLYDGNERVRIRETAFPQLQRDLRWRGEVTGLRREGSLFAAEISLAATRDGHLICSCRDITIADAARKTLDERSQMLERASRAKDDFLASMSHELRTPLAGILMITESLLRNTYGPVTPRQSRVLALLEESGRHLLDLINDILDLSKIEAGKLELAIEDVPALDLAEAVMRMIRGPADQKNISLAMTVEPPDLVIRADARRLKQMLLNLLGNGVKFTPQGGHVALDIGLSPDRAFVLLHVSDTGIGIDPDTFDKLFKPFVQVDSGLARQYSGTGLGLPLVLRMAELHQGGVTVESRLGSGSTFTIRLPYHAKSEDAAHAADTLATRASDHPDDRLHGRLLVVEDNPVTLTVLHDYLAARGFTVQTATSGAAAVMAALGEPPDLVLMDIQMPGMDGFEATRLLRNQPDPRLALVPIIALTALAMPGDRERCLLAGMNHYVTKPVQLDTLVESISMLLRTDNRAATTSGHPP